MIFVEILLKTLMIKILEDIKEIISAQLHYKSNTKTFQLKELALQSNCPPVEIKTSSNDVLSFKLDARLKSNNTHVSRFPFFKEIPNRTNSHQKISDYVIFYYKNNTLYTFICELKSGNTDGACFQIVSGKHFVDFLISVIKRCNDIEINVKQTLLLFSTNPPYKNNCKRVSYGGENYLIEHYHANCVYELDYFIR